MIVIFIFEEEDLEKLRERDPETFTKLYNEYGKRIYNYLLVKVNGNKEIAEDLSNETFYSVYIAIPELKKAKNIKSWIFQIASSKFYDFIRKQNKEKKFLDTTTENGFSNDDIINNLLLKEKMLMLDLAMDKLNKNYKKVLTLKYKEKKTEKEISKIMDRSISAVESMLFKARKKLKKELIVLEGYF